MKKYKKAALELLNTPTFIIPLIIVAIASFGYLLSHSTINVDVLSADRYFQGTELVAQQRIIAPLIDKVFNILNFNPFLVDFMAMLLFILDTILYCSLFKIISQNKIKPIAYTIFSCLFISYPLVMEIITYVPMGIIIALGFALIAISIIFIYEFFVLHKKRFFFLSTLFLWFAMSLYESFVLVYIMGILGIFLIKILFSNKNDLEIKDFIFDILLCIISLLVAFLWNYIITNLILCILKIPLSNYADKKILYTIYGFSKTIPYLIHTVIIDYIINAFGYLPITFLVISMIISITMGVIFSIRRKNISIILIILAMNFTLFLLSIIQGKASVYRTCQQFQLFIPFVFMILTHVILNLCTKKRTVKNIFLFIVFIMIFYQVKEMYTLQYLNDIRYQKEKSDMLRIGYEISEKYDASNKPVVFVENYTLPKYITDEIYIKPNSLHYKILQAYNEHFLHQSPEYILSYRRLQTSVQSYIDWGITAFAHDALINIENIKFFNFLGFDFKAGTISMFVDGLKQKDEKNMPHWPKEGSIIETEEYILVNL